MRTALSLACLALVLLGSVAEVSAFHGRGGPTRYQGDGNVWGGYRGYQNWGPYGSANYPGRHPEYAGSRGPVSYLGHPGQVDHGHPGHVGHLGNGAMHAMPAGPVGAVCPNCHPQP